MSSPRRAEAGERQSGIVDVVIPGGTLCWSVVPPAK